MQMSRDDLTDDILEAENLHSHISSSATDLADHSRVVGGILVEQPVSGNLPYADYGYIQCMQASFQCIISLFDSLLRDVANASTTHDSLILTDNTHADATTRLLGDSDIQLELYV